MVERGIDRANDRQRGEMGVERAGEQALDLIRQEHTALLALTRQAGAIRPRAA